MTTRMFPFKVGSFECWTIADSSFAPDADYLFYNAPPEALAEALDAKGLDPAGIEVPVNNMVIRTPDRGVVLIDTGQGVWGEGESEGRLLANLSKAGITADEVQLVVLTHGHTDHIGGVLDKNLEPLYPRADYVMSRIDWGYFTAVTVLDAADDGLAKVGWTAISAGEATITRGTLLNRHVRDHLTLVEDPVYEVLPGIELIAAPGHTIGHSIVRVTSKGESLLNIVDVAVTPIHMEHPDWLIRADLATEIVATTRREIFGKLAEDQTRVFADHFPFPCLGTVSPLGDAWCWKAEDH